MTLYQEFNKWVYEYYLETCIPGSSNTLTIPNSILENFKAEYNCSFSSFNEIKFKSWKDLIQAPEGIPLYFGLIALQCHAAYLMQNDSGITAANYKKPFADLVGLKSPDELESLFSEGVYSSISQKVQEVIWLKAKAYLQKKGGFLINLPEVKTGAGRYIQFPKEQVILNYEDLKEYNQILKAINQKFENEVLSFDDFKRCLRIEIPKYLKSFKRKNNTNFDSCLTESEKRIKYKQIFDYYNSLNWLKVATNDKPQLKGSDTCLYLKFYEGNFYIYNQEFKELSDSEANECLRKSKFLLFERNPVYQNEYESVKSFSFQNDNFIIIYNAPTNSIEIKELDKLYSRIIDYSGTKNIIVYKIEPRKGIPSFLISLIASDYPIKLVGYKTLGGKKYFSSAPPKIVAINETPFVLYFNNRRVSLTDIKEVGTYTIKVNGYTNYNFELIDPSNLVDFCPKLETAFSFKSLEVVNKTKGNMIGLCVSTADIPIINNLTITSWAKTLAGQKSNSQNLILKVISQKQYGKNF